MLVSRLLPVLAIGLGASLAMAGPQHDLLVATELPVQAHELRKDGVPDAEVEEAITAAEEAGLPAAETAEVLEAEVKAEKKHGRIDNFGAFVKGQIKEGKRGTELAAAIHAEHEQRGMGKGKGKGKGRSEDKGKPEHAGKGGKSGDHGKPDGKGKPEHAGKGGKSGDHGKGNGSGGGKGKGKNR